MYDLIGDIHGHADELVQLLELLGYEKARGSYCHPDRKVVFLGDFIDRGPKIRQVLEIVRPMIEERHALAVMGNHELNALAYHTEDPKKPGKFLRRHSDKNVHQHSETVLQLKPRELRFYLEWFRTLPMWLDQDGLRVVHACWDDNAITKIAQAQRKHRGVTTSFLQAAYSRKNSLFGMVETVLKGKEAKLPNGKSFLDKDRNKRTEIRTKWYLPPTGHTFGSYALQSDRIRCDVKLTKAVIVQASPYPTNAKPVFIGHYWLWAKKRPRYLVKNVACLETVSKPRNR